MLSSISQHRESYLPTPTWHNSRCQLDATAQRLFVRLAGSSHFTLVGFIWRRDARDDLPLLNVDERGRLDFGCEQRLYVPRCYLIHEHLATKNAARIGRAGGDEFDYERSGPISPHSTRPPEPPFSGTSV